MNKILLAVAAVVVIGSVFLSLSMYDQTAVAGSNDGAASNGSIINDEMVGSDKMEYEQKYRFTQTMTSDFSPGVGHEGHQIVRILEPSEGIIYSGTLTYVTSEPIDIVVIHEIDNADAQGQAIWRIDDDTVYGWTFVDIDSKAGSFEYSGAGLLLHTGGDVFTATFTVEGDAGKSRSLSLTSSLDTQ